MNQRNSYYRSRVAVLDRRSWLVRLVLLAAVVAAGLTMAGRVSAQSAEAKDFFGTVVSVSDHLLMVVTEQATVGVVITTETRVRLPLKQEATVTDLVPGDRVAVSLTEKGGRLVADKVFLVPDKPRFRHVPGTVVARTDNRVIIQPLDPNAMPITFLVNGGTPVRLRNRVTTWVQADDLFNPATEGLVGRFVVMSFAMRGNNAPLQAIEILVTEGGPPVQPLALTLGSPALESPRRVEIRGVFSGVDADGLWIINGTRVRVDPEATVDDGLVAGQAVAVTAGVDSNGILLALTVEQEDNSPSNAQRIRLDGIFQGLDSQRRWLVSGTAVAVGPRSHTDELPYLGQRLRVVAVRQEDGMLLAREVENLSSRPQAAPSVWVKLQGLLEGIDAQGKWTVSGIKVSVGPGTKLEALPAVGRPVMVTAERQEDGSLLAQQIEGRNEEITHRRGQAQIVGPVEQILDNGSLVVSGVVVTRTALTELDGNPQVGSLVVVEALLLEDGTLLAREVHLGREVEELGLTPVRESEIRGAVERVNPDATMVVGGVTVVIGALTDFRVDVAEGVVVRVAGVLQSDGSLLAREVKDETPGESGGSNQVRIQGPISEVQRDPAGNPVGVVVAGSQIALEALTRLESPLDEGTDVDVRGVATDGGLLASRISDVKRESQPEAREVTLEGRIKSLMKNQRGQAFRITVNELTVNIATSTKVSGPLSGGELVVVNGVLRNGAVAATTVEIKTPAPAPAPAKAKRSPFQVKGPVTGVQVDSLGKLQSLTVEARTIQVEGLTKVDRGVAVGRIVEVKGVVVGDTYVANQVKVKDQPKDRPEDQKKKR